MLSHHPAKYGRGRHCGSGDMFLVTESKASPGSHLNHPLLFISKTHADTPNKIFASPFRSTVDKKKVKKRTTIVNLFCVTRKRNKEINSLYWNE